MTVGAYLNRHGTSILALAKLSGVSYQTLHPHVRHGRQLGLQAAKKLEAATGGEITAAEVLGLAPPPAPRAKRKASTRRAA